jgi:hypothetical protein
MLFMLAYKYSGVHHVLTTSKMPSDLSDAVTAYPSQAPEITPGILVGSVWFILNCPFSFR